MYGYLNIAMENEPFSLLTYLLTIYILYSIEYI